MSEITRGIVLAGGNGTRLRSMADGSNKHMVQVHDRPMIEYPLRTLQEMGITRTTIVSSPTGVGELARYVKDGSKWGQSVEYKVQPRAKGMADALGHAAVSESVFVVLCGDTYHSPAPKLDGHVQLWWTRQDGMNNGAIWEPLTNRIIEKPARDLGRNAIIGARVYDQRAIRMIEHLEPSDRGELELVDIDNYYLENELTMSYYSGFFGDMGTPEGLARVERYIRED